MFEAWNIIDSGLSGNSNGHQYWEAKALADELAGRNVATRIFCHQTRTKPNVPGAQTFPVFPLSINSSFSDDPLWGYAENFFVHNRIFLQTLASIERSKFFSSLVLMPNMSEYQMLGAVRWLAQFSDQERPKTVMLLEPVKGWSNDGSILARYKKIWADCPLEVKRGIHICVRQQMLAERYGLALSFTPTVLPHPFAFSKGEYTTSHAPVCAKPITISFVGGARRERGVDLLPEIVEQCSSQNVRFVIQVRPGADLGFDDSMLSNLAGRENVEIHHGAMPTEAYYSVMANSMVLLAYDSDRYHCRGSGVYLEAKCLGAPVIVSPGNWVADEVGSLGNGIICAERSAVAIVEAIRRAEHQIVDLRARSADLAHSFRAQHGVARFVDSVLKLTGERST